MTIVTTGFTDAVEVQSTAMGFDPAVVYVPHPIQNRTPDELKKIADDIIEPALKMLAAG